MVEVLSIQLTMHAVYIATRKLQEQLAQEFHVEAGAREGVLPFEEAVTQWPRQHKTLPVWPRNTTTPVLLLEIRRRKYALLLNLLRSPLFDSATLPALKHLSHLFEHVPVLRSIPSYCINFATYMNQYYFNHSGSS